MTVPGPKSVTITSSLGIIVHKGSNVTLICSVQMNEAVSAFELSLLVVNASLTRPDGSTLLLSNPLISDTTYSFITQVNSFGDSDVGNYTCTATIGPQPSSIFLTGIDQKESIPINIEIGK